MKSLATLSVLLLLLIEINAEGCTIDILELPAPQPIVIEAYSRKIIYPTGFDNFDTRITIARGELITISCAGGNLANFNATLVFAACNIFDQLIVNAKAINFSSIKCESADFGALMATNQVCGTETNTKIIEIGLDINPGYIFVPLVTVCYDFTRRTAVYANFTMTKHLSIGPVHYMDSFKEDLAFLNLTVPVSSLYDVNTTRSTINSQLGLDLQSEKYVKNAFHQEQLVRPEEFFYTAEAQTVHRSLVTWPQWRGCYTSDELHSAVYRYVVTKKIDLEVYTGTYGTASLPHEQTGKPTEIYLYNEGDVKAVPVPAMLWRLVYEPQSKRAVVLFGIDNTDIVNGRDLVLCNDVSDYVEWAYFSQFCGLGYACSYQDAKRVLPYLPELDVTDLLLE